MPCVAMCLCVCGGGACCGTLCLLVCEHRPGALHVGLQQLGGRDQAGLLGRGQACGLGLGAGGGAAANTGHVLRRRKHKGQRA